jgi:hypothetical protein
VTQVTGKLEERKTPKKQLFQVILKKTSMADPSNPSKSITVEVPTEIPYVPNRKASGKLNKLKQRFQRLKKREAELKAQFAQARSKLVDMPVVEDGAPGQAAAMECAAAGDNGNQQREEGKSRAHADVARVSVRSRSSPAWCRRRLSLCHLCLRARSLPHTGPRVTHPRLHSYRLASSRPSTHRRSSLHSFLRLQLRRIVSR